MTFFVAARAKFTSCVLSTDPVPVGVTAPTNPAWLTLTEPVDTSTPGTYTVEDSAGDQALAERTVVVQAAPPPPPPPPPPSSGGGGGSLGLGELLTFMLFGLVAISRRRKARGLFVS